MNISRRYVSPQKYLVGGNKIKVLLGIMINPSIHKRLWKVAFSEGKSMTKYIEELLDKILQKDDEFEIEINSNRKIKC